MRTVRVLKDFGERGIPASSVNLDYSDIWNYELPSNVENGLAMSWADSLRKNPKMENKALFNYKQADDKLNSIGTVMVTLGTSTFRDYNETRQFLDGKKDPAAYGLTPIDVAILEREVHVVSSFPAVKVGNYVVMGNKSWKVMEAGAGKVSFPGAGYLQVDKETFIYDGNRYTRQLQQIVRREVEEEMAIKENEMSKVTVMGIAEDTFKGSHRNPGIFSIVDADITVDELMKRKNIAQDAWEHEGPYVLLPTDDPALLESYIESDINGVNKTLSDEYAKRIPGLGSRRSIDTTGKAQFMLYTLGKNLYGNNWLKEVLEKQSQTVKVY